MAAAPEAPDSLSVHAEAPSARQPHIEEEDRLRNAEAPSAAGYQPHVKEEDRLRNAEAPSAAGYQPREEEEDRFRNAEAPSAAGYQPREEEEEDPNETIRRGAHKEMCRLIALEEDDTRERNERYRRLRNRYIEMFNAADRQKRDTRER